MPWSQVAIHTLWLGLDVNQATDIPRFHHQLLPDEIGYEKEFDKVSICVS